MILPPTLLHFPAISGNVKKNHPRNNDAAQNSRDSLPEPLTECQPSQPTPDWTGLGQPALTARPEWGEGPSGDPGPATLGSPAPPGGLYLYLSLMSAHQKNALKNFEKGSTARILLPCFIGRVSKHLHQISNYLTFPLENLTSLEHLNLNFQVTSQQVYRIFFLFHTLR